MGEERGREKGRNLNVKETHRLVGSLTLHPEGASNLKPRYVSLTKNLTGDPSLCGPIELYQSGQVISLLTQHCIPSPSIVPAT